jgi:6-pyruvoyltetrahydropterin/6-carboxytetrahydropterin synthase
MFRLTREVRFAVNPDAPDPAPSATAGANGYAGVPPLLGFGQFLTLQVTLVGDLDPSSHYLRNIKEIDEAVRRLAVPLLADRARAAFRHEDAAPAGAAPPSPVAALLDAFAALRGAWPGASLDALRLGLSPYLSLAVHDSEFAMPAAAAAVRHSHKFEFSASHRLHNPDFTDEQNRRTFGKCSNPHGHGHNYELQVTLAGPPDAVSGLLIDLPAFERIVAATVIDRFDHRNLNVEVPEFNDLIPSVENIARVIYRLLRPKFADAGAKLASVTVWETPKTWCEYAE